jgi:YVTN family beta-propeller protein
MRRQPLPIVALLLAPALAAPAAAQHAQSSSVAVNPTDANEVWVANRGNNSVAVVDVAAGATVAEIPVGVWPRSVALTPDGETAFVANQRGDVPVTTNFVTPFLGTETRGTITVIDVTTRQVTQTLSDVGTEPYGLAVAPSGLWFAVTGFRSGTVKLYSTSGAHPLLATFQYDRSLDVIAPGKTIADVDSNVDFVPDLAEPRALVIRADGQRILVAHALPGFVSALDVTLGGGGLPTAIALAAKIDLDTYPFDPLFNPTPVQTLQSQGLPRFLDDIALSPDGSLALVPHVLHNVNHDVNHAFGPGLAGDFANRVYPALSVIDAANTSFGQPGDLSRRLHHELSEPLEPAESIPYGGQGLEIGGGILTLGGVGAPLVGGTMNFTVSGSAPADFRFLFFSGVRTRAPAPPYGTVLALPIFLIAMAGPVHSLQIPANPALEGRSFYFQAAVLDGTSGAPKGFTNGVEVFVSADGFDVNGLGHRAGHPGRVRFNAAGNRALLLNRGSEDVFLYRVQGTDFQLMTVFPPRHDHIERAPLDPGTPLGDLPLGMALVADPTTSNDDALLYVVNETSRTLSTLRVDWATGVITKEASQIDTVLGPDEMTVSERLGQELFEDASRAQTAGNFNNSCGSCHFEGGADGNVWQRGSGPRSTMPVYGGSLLTGLILWKGVRLNMGETGPMFGGENGGTGIFTDAEQQALVDYHRIVPVPLNPNLDPITGQYSPQAALGKDLFFGTNDTGLNPSLRHAGCATCHPDADDMTGAVRGYTVDFLDPILTDGENLGSVDPNCFSLQENLVAVNLRNVNSGVNVDMDDDGFPDMDRNSDGFIDLESYAPMNVDDKDPFMRDDPNSYPCPLDIMNPGGPKKTFLRDATLFSIPTKLGVFSTGPYFHDHAVVSLRMLLDPQSQTTDPVYGDPSFPALNKFFNEFHDVRGNDTFVPNASKVQLTLQTIANGSTFDADIEALLAYILSL